MGHPRVLRASRDARSNGGQVDAWLSFYIATSGAANTAFSVAHAVQPNQDTNWASWQAVFDEMKVVQAEFYWLAYFTTVPSALPANTPNAAIAYEPAGNTPPTSVNQVLQYDKFSLLNIAGGASTSYQASPQAVQSNGGYMKLKAVIPDIDTPSASSTTLSTGLWRPTTDASNYFWGQFVGYVAAGGTSAVIRIESFVRMKVRFRWLR